MKGVRLVGLLISTLMHCIQGCIDTGKRYVPVVVHGIARIQGSIMIKTILGIIIGGGIGFAIGYYGKCVSGTCPMTSNPVISTVLGALIGAMLMMMK